MRSLNPQQISAEKNKASNRCRAYRDCIKHHCISSHIPLIKPRCPVETEHSVRGAPRESAQGSAQNAARTLDDELRIQSCPASVMDDIKRINTFCSHTLYEYKSNSNHRHNDASVKLYTERSWKSLFFSLTNYEQVRHKGIH